MDSWVENKMYLVECLDDLGVFAKKGEKLELNNNSTHHWEKKGKIKIIKYLGNYHNSQYYKMQAIRSCKRQIEELKRKIKEYEKDIKEMEKK